MLRARDGTAYATRLATKGSVRVRELSRLDERGDATWYGLFLLVELRFVAVDSHLLGGAAISTAAAGPGGGEPSDALVVSRPERVVHAGAPAGRRRESGRSWPEIVTVPSHLCG